MSLFNGVLSNAMSASDRRSRSLKRTGVQADIALAIRMTTEASADLITHRVGGNDDPPIAGCLVCFGFCLPFNIVMPV